MPKRSGEKRDFMQVAKAVVEQAIGEEMDGSTLPAEPNAKQRAGSKGGEKGGVSRAKVLTAEQRCQIAVKAARARWK